MVNLKRLSNIPRKKSCYYREYMKLKETDFHPDELKQLRDMNDQQLKQLLIFCGIHSFDGIPLIVMEEDEMRWAYTVWRGEQFKEKQRKFTKKVERGIRWVNVLQKAVELMK